MSLKISSHLILLMHFLTIIVFNLMAIFTYDLPLYWVWISNIGIGIGCGSVYPTIYSFSATELSDRQQEDSDSVVRGRMRGCPLSIYRGNFNSGPTLSVNVRQHNQYYYLFDIIVFYKTYNQQIQSYGTTSTRAHHWYVWFAIRLMFKNWNNWTFV